ncbi:hypothetical protein V1512DRAFT_247478 [Lipomyces arxii]|uniref:uncharacterized protein n=1 Tax=Lipomyces arxii TaxID=56418 RepID=UPI0034CF5150
MRIQTWIHTVSSTRTPDLKLTVSSSSRHGTVCIMPSCTARSDSQTDPEIDSSKQLRRTDLGQTLDTLTQMLPNLQHELPPSSLLSPHIQLRFFPKTHPGLPSIRGKTAYLATWRVTQWILPFFVLGPIDGLVEMADDSKRKGVHDGSAVTNLLGMVKNVPAEHRKGSIVFKIVSMKVVNEDSDISDDDVSSTANGPEPESDIKLLVRWQILFAGPADESQATADTLSGQTQNQTQPSVVTGLFTFEFDRDGKILVHSIDDVEEIRSQKTAGSSNGLKKLARAVARRGDEEGPVVVDDERETHGIPRRLA